MYLKPKVKHSVSNQDKPATFFFRELQDLARNAYPVDAVRNEILLTTFIAGLSNSSVRWEVRIEKSADADAALQVAVETHSFLEIDGLKLQTSGVNIISTKTPLDTFTDLVRSLPTEIQNTVATSHVPTEKLPRTVKEIVRTVKTATDISLSHQDWDSITTFPTSKTYSTQQTEHHPKQQHSEE